MSLWSRLKRWVAPGLCLGAGGRRPRPDAGSRPSWRSFAGLCPGTVKELVALAWPITAGMLGETALGLCDVAVIERRPPGMPPPPPGAAAEPAPDPLELSEGER